ncbi:hypothetical protein GSY74_07570 [Sulfurovum sp. bin170]|uniref:hypothetical protein n=1 Tax=Sulfurovum sp. bin170 TaxID=2695268 RepID=UPI0013E07334|nr:hypothetical protein [Sulfurovum sp. bin170]NEW61137.1 hypothetical protein [Sulfurovum sp. bin170]
MSKILLSIALPITIFAEGVVVPDNYKISENEDVSYVYTSEYAEILPKMKAYQQDLMQQYEDDFGYKLDDTLFVGLASKNNQIANGFSTQIPFNSQLYYGAGVGHIDYFCFNSWLKTLIIHETAHNFQLNAKESKASWLSHKIVGNTPVSFLGLFPFFPIPNLLESNFLLEGNAVMNESRFDNGGRLYSGYALAEVVALAKADKIKPELIYNETFDFPYGEKVYLVGGFFQQFLVEKYGVKKVNHYFKLHSKQLFPFFTNAAFKNLFGKTFKTLLAEFVTEIKTKHANFKSTKGKIIAKSQSFVPMNSSDNEIYTVISDLENFPQILKYSRDKKEISYQEGACNRGEPFKIDEKYNTQSSSKTSPTKIVMGLFDNDSYLKEGTESKVIQGYMPDGRAVYFNLDKSLETPHIYIGQEFYGLSHSSVHIDKDGNLYYFKQKGQTRTLYRNKKALFDYQGHYGFVTDVDSIGAIYFIAKSEHGSTAYRYSGAKTERVTAGDDVIDFKLINGTEAVVATIDSEEYKYQTLTISPKDAKVFNTNYEIEDKKSKVTQNSQPFEISSTKLKSKEYNSLTQLRYSSLDQFVGYSTEDGVLFNLRANFVDPLMQNILSPMLSHDDERTVGGIGYQSQAHSLEFGGSLYGVEYDEEIDVNSTDRDHGYSAYLKLPFLATGYWRGSSTLEYSKEYDSAYRKPLTLSFDIINNKQFGKSKFPNHLNYLNLFTSKDRDSNALGASYTWMHDLGWQSYVGLRASYLKSDNVDERFERGIEIDDNWGDIQNDSASITMPTLDKTLYAKEAKVAGATVYKVFDTPLYFFSFPVSLQRETIYLKHRFYDFELPNENRQYNETTIGLESDILFFHKLPVPIKLEWLYNEDSEDKSLFRILLGSEF